ncbi:MAG: hypothetical protein L0241_21265 [Planctomycetia bacterium]|nr:hypothetical protein [Planctomycetia bacterium]
MSIRYFLARLTRKVIVAASVAVGMWVSGSASASDVPSAPASEPGNLFPIPTGSCAACEHGKTKSGVAIGGPALLGKGHARPHKGKELYSVNLCPGACFGYFQTQWRKWDEVCPYPYLGIGPGNISNPPTGPFIPKPPVLVPGTPLTPPRPLDPKMLDPKKTGGSDLPMIPTPSKFTP